MTSAPADQARSRSVIVALAVTTTVGYGVLYYAFSALLAPMSHDLGISGTSATGALTVSVLVSALMAVPVGRWLDRHGGRGLMTVGSVLASIAVLAWSQVQSAVQLYLVFTLIGVASAMVLYQPAFAVIVAITEPRRRSSALLSVTLVAGFASSIFVPLTGQLIHSLGWHHALLVLAAVVTATVPLHGLALRGVGPAVVSAARRSSPARVLRDNGFWLIATAFVLHNAALAVIAVHLVVYLTKLGHAPTIAAGLTGLLGVLSVTGRIVTTVAKRWLPITLITAAVMVLQGVAIGALPFVGTTITGAAISLVLFGLGFGVASVATPAILLERYGADGYATISGILATPATIGRATAPLGAAALVPTIGYQSLILTAAATCLFSAAALAATWRM